MPKPILALISDGHPVALHSTQLHKISGTSPSNPLQRLGLKRQQRPETPALISRIHTSSSHHALCQQSDSVLPATTTPITAKGEGRPSRWKDGLTRSFVHCSRPSQYVLPLGISLAMGLKEEGRSVWLVATLGPLGPGVKRDSYGAPRRTVQRSID